VAFPLTTKIVKCEHINIDKHYIINGGSYGVYVCLSYFVFIYVLCIKKVSNKYKTFGFDVVWILVSVDYKLIANISLLALIFSCMQTNTMT